MGYPIASWVKNNGTTAPKLIPGTPSLRRTRKDVFFSWNFRFYGEIKSGISKTGKLVFPSANPENFGLIPPGCYDVIDGYFHPKRMSIYDYKTGEELRVIDADERDWIVNNCRSVPGGDE